MSALRLTACTALLALSALTAPAQTSGKLSIDFIDVEGGQATLFVTPTHQSLLIDTGWGGNNGRDAERISAAAKKAGLARIDFVLITHFHTDHVGGVPQLVSRIPVGTFIDHGPARETNNPDIVKSYADYEKVLAAGPAKHLVLGPGDRLPLNGLNVVAVSGDGRLIAKPLPRGGANNPFCNGMTPPSPDTTENARSLGLLLSFGKFTLLDLGDLTMDKEVELMCPVNKLGNVDVLVVSNHGSYQSSAPALVFAVHPRVAIMDNGANKGGSSQTFSTFNISPGLDALWQLHFSNEAGPALNRPEGFIANLSGTDEAHSLELTASPDGGFTVYNDRTGASTSYPASPMPIEPR